MADFFISYNKADAAVADEIARALNEADFSVRFAGWEMKLGMKIGTWMRKATEDADRMIAICSPDYFKEAAEFSGWELDSYMWFDVGGNNSSVIPVIVAECTMPKLMADRLYHDHRTKPLSDLIDGLRDLDTDLVPPRGAPPPPRAARRVGVFPPAYSVVGREDDVELLRAGLKREGDAAIVNGAVVQGEGGIGKTTLARYYVDRFGTDYDFIFWGNGETKGALVNALYDLYPDAFGKPPPPDRTEEVARACIRQVEATGKRWLFVYDNVSAYRDIEPFLPEGHLIITTREGRGWRGFATHRTDVLAYDTADAPAVQLLMAEAGRSDDAAGARDLAEALGGLPLALVIAGAMLRDTSEQSFADYLEKIGTIIAREPEHEAYPTSVIGAVRLSYDKLPEDARRVADLFAWWAPEGLQGRLITDAVEGGWEANKGEIPDDVQALAQSPDRVAAAVEALEARSLLRRDGDGFALHRMTAAALRAMQGDRAQAGAAAALLAAAYPLRPDHSGNWDDCRRLTPQVRALWASGRAPEIAAMDFLLNQAAIFLDRIADFQGGAEMARASLELKQARLPEEHREIAVGHGTLGVALQRLGDLPGAVTELRRAVALNAAHRSGSRDLADSSEMLGGALLDLGRGGDRAALVEALRLCQRAGALWRRLVARDSEERAKNLNNLAAVRSALGQPAAALRLLGYALAIQRRVLPPGDARLGSGLMNAGAAALTTGAADRAEPLLEEALALRQTVYVEAPRHPEIVTTAGWLVSCYLVRARAGENPGLRTAKAKRLCEEYGFDFEREVEQAKQYPYTPEGGAA